MLFCKGILYFVSFTLKVISNLLWNTQKRYFVCLLNIVYKKGQWCPMLFGPQHSFKFLLLKKNNLHIWGKW